MACMSIRNECNKCGKHFLASCESLCPDCKKSDGDYAVLADVRALIDIFCDFIYSVELDEETKDSYSRRLNKISEHFR